VFVPRPQSYDEAVVVLPVEGLAVNPASPIWTTTVVRQYDLIMSKSTDDILNTAKTLSTTERAELAAALITSLEGEPDAVVDAAWAAEIQLHVESVRSGVAKVVPRVKSAE
jgi:hypothetical protein